MKFMGFDDFWSIPMIPRELTAASAVLGKLRSVKIFRSLAAQWFTLKDLWGAPGDAQNPIGTLTPNSGVDMFYHMII